MNERERMAGEPRRLEKFDRKGKTKKESTEDLHLDLLNSNASPCLVPNCRARGSREYCSIARVPNSSISNLSPQNCFRGAVITVFCRRWRPSMRCKYGSETLQYEDSGRRRSTRIDARVLGADAIPAVSCSLCHDAESSQARVRTGRQDMVE